MDDCVFYDNDLFVSLKNNQYVMSFWSLLSFTVSVTYIVQSIINLIDKVLCIFLELFLTLSMKKRCVINVKWERMKVLLLKKIMQYKLKYFQVWYNLIIKIYDLKLSIILYGKLWVEVLM